MCFFALTLISCQNISSDFFFPLYEYPHVIRKVPMFKFVPFVVILWQTETKLNQKKKNPQTPEYTK